MSRKTVKIGPDNWSQCAPLLIFALENANEKGKQIAREELLRMAKVADLTLEEEKCTQGKRFKPNI